MKRAIELQGTDAVVEYHYKKNSDCADSSRVNENVEVSEIRHYIQKWNDDGYKIVGMELRIYSRQFIMELYNAMQATEANNVQISKTDYEYGKKPYDDIPF